MKKRKKVKKGTYGYIRYQKIRTTLVTIGLFVLPLAIFTVGFIQTGTRKNWFTILAILGCLPACKSLVSMIMILMQKSVGPQVYEQAKTANGNLTAGYELVFTAYEHSYPVNTLVVCGDQVLCYTPDEKADTAYLEKHITRVLSVNGFTSAQVKVMKDFKKYLQRASDICAKQDHYREGIAFTPDERYPELSRDELIFHTLLAISL